MTPALIFLAEALAVQLIVLTLFHMRHRYGLAPLYACLGVFQVLQTVIAPVLVEIAPRVLVSPGSAILFASLLPTILLVYIKEDLAETRKLIYSIVFANIVASLFLLVISLQLRNGLAIEAQALSLNLFSQTSTTLAFGTALLFIDAVLIPILYEVFSRVLRRAWLRVLLPPLVVAVLDSLLFVVAQFGSDPAFNVIFASSVAGKTAVIALFSVLIVFYFQRFEGKSLQGETSTTKRNPLDIFTYRERYEQMSAWATQDSLTGLYNRAFFDESIESHIAAAKARNQTGALLLIDIDNFKPINDQYGHIAGDETLQALAVAIRTHTRRSDAVCRYGGDEFAIILPEINRENAIMVAEKVRETVQRMVLPQYSATVDVTCTIGIAFFPEEAEDVLSAVHLADLRLYQGKRSGRNVVVAL